MNEERLSKKKLEWCPTGRRRAGKTSKYVEAGSNSWNEKRELRTWNISTRKNGEGK